MKQCKKCHEFKPATTEYFVKNYFKGADSVSNECRDCHKVAMRVINKRNYKENRVKRLLSSYKQMDEKNGLVFSMDEAQSILAIRNGSCFFCHHEDDLGFDRVDDTIGHTDENTVVCCSVCNIVQNNIFTIDEMKTLGAQIMLIRYERGAIPLLRKRKKYNA